MKTGESRNNVVTRFRTFEDLEVYQAARELRRTMYRVANRLPAEEKYALASQIRRAAVSHNIAKGHGRFYFLEQIKFALQSRGSLEELIDDLNVCDDQRYLETAEISEVKQQGWRVYQLLNGYFRYLRRPKAGASLKPNESSPAGDFSDEELNAIADEQTGESVYCSTV